MSYHHWTGYEIAKAKKMQGEGESNEAIAQSIGKDVTDKSVASLFSRLKLKRGGVSKKTFHWTEENKQALDKMFHEGKKDREIADTLGSTKMSVSNMRVKMGMKRMEKPLHLIGKQFTGKRFPNDNKPYSREEESIIKKILSEASEGVKRTAHWGMRNAKRLAKALGRRPKAVYSKISRDGWLKRDLKKPIDQQKLGFPEISTQKEVVKQSQENTTNDNCSAVYEVIGKYNPAVVEDLKKQNIKFIIRS